jgi:hypothetical protein
MQETCIRLEENAGKLQKPCTACGILVTQETCIYEYNTG